MNPEKKSNTSSSLAIINCNYHGQNMGNYANERKIQLNINLGMTAETWAK
jgi:hypothetical protein